MAMRGTPKLNEHVNSLSMWIPQCRPWPDHLRRMLCGNRCFPSQCTCTAASSGQYSGNSITCPSLVCHPWSLCARLVESVSTKVYLTVHTYMYKVRTCRHMWFFACDVQPLTRTISTKVYSKVCMYMHADICHFFPEKYDYCSLFIPHHFDCFRGHGRHMQAMCGYISRQRCTYECEATVSKII